MFSLKKILTIAFYEAKTLFRSWFFRIFLTISLILLISINVGLFVLPASSRWMFYGIPSSIPYLNIMLFGIVQAIIGIFMASDFLKYDYKLNTTEVIYIRSMTNTEYVLGKVLGILTVFAGLNLVVLLISFVFNFFFTDVGLTPVVYLLYPVLINLPSLLFVIGLTFLLMIIFKSQAVTFISLLGYSAVSLFFLSQELNHLFDFIGLNLPWIYSDFIGFGDFSQIFTHRTIYFLLGTTFIFVSALLLRRLSQSRVMNIISFTISVICIITAVTLTKNYISKISEGKNLRKEILELNEKLNGISVVSISKFDIDLIHIKDEIEVKATMEFKNETTSPIDRLIFSLNPGLKIKNIVYNGNNPKYTRDLHILSIEPEHILKPGESGNLTIEYRGRINEDACYTEISEESREISHRLSFYNLGKRYSFITPEYVLLTPENNWYPYPGINGGNIYSGKNRMDFIDFNLTVDTAFDLQAISQGKVSSPNPGKYVFVAENPMPCLSLIIGRYENKSIVIDSVTYSINYLKGHDYFSQYFDKIDKKLEENIKAQKTDFENRLELKYQYQRLSMIETPIQFFAYPRVETQSTENILPEQVLLPEKGVTLSSADFKSLSYFFESMRGRMRRQLSPEDIQDILLRRFIDNTFLTAGTEESTPGFFRRIGEDESLVSKALSSIADQNGKSDYSIFPLYYTYTRHFSSERWPMFNTVIEYHLINKISDLRSIFRQIFTGLSEQDKANLILINHSFSEILKNPYQYDNLSEIIKLKSTYLFSLIRSRVDNEEFESFIKNYLDSVLYKDQPVEVFLSEFEKKFNIKLEHYFDSWMYDKKLPAFVISDIESYEIIEENRTRYQVKFDITNMESTEGIVYVEFRTRGGFGGDRRRFSPPEPEGETSIMLKGNQSKRVGIILDSQPFLMTINTLVSKNIPSLIVKNFQREQTSKEVEPFEGQVVLENPVYRTGEGTIIVDNEDSGFTVHSEVKTSYLMRMLHAAEKEEEEYTGIFIRNVPADWQATVGGNYYGTYRLSAYYIRAGNGEKSVSWTAQIPQSGTYDVYFYVPDLGRIMFRRRDRDNQVIQDFHFKIHHDDGTDNITLNLSNAEEGWFLLGTFYFSKGRAKVELSNKSRGRIVFADALRWTERE